MPLLAGHYLSEVSSLCCFCKISGERISKRCDNERGTDYNGCKVTKLLFES